MTQSEVLIYQNPDGKIRLDVRLEDETVWLTQDQMADLFGKAKSTINEHIKNIFAEGELSRSHAPAWECIRYRSSTQSGFPRRSMGTRCKARIRN